MFVCITFSGNLEGILASLRKRSLFPKKYMQYIAVIVRDSRQAMRLYSIFGVASVYAPRFCQHGRLRYDPLARLLVEEIQGSLVFSKHLRCPECGASLKDYRIEQTSVTNTHHGIK